jgi:hypothetical protein
MGYVHSDGKFYSADFSCYVAAHTQSEFPGRNTDQTQSTENNSKTPGGNCPNTSAKARTFTCLDSSAGSSRTASDNSCIDIRTQNTFAAYPETRIETAAAACRCCRITNPNRASVGLLNGKSAGL